MPAQVPNANAQDIARRRTHWGTAWTRTASKPNQSSRLHHMAAITMGVRTNRELESMPHSQPPIECHPQNSMSEMLRTSSQAAELTPQFDSTANGRPNKAQVRNSSYTSAPVW